MSWVDFFLKLEFNDTIKKYNSSFTPGPDYLLWSYIKELVLDNKCLTNIVNIANICAILHSKAFYLIVLLNILSKLIKKVISNRVQFHAISLEFLHPNQIGELKQRSFIDAGVYLTYLIWAG